MQRFLTVVLDRNVLDATLLVVGVDESAHDASPRSPVSVREYSTAVARVREGDGIATVVGMPRLGLNREKDSGPAIVAGLVNDEAAIGPDLVVVPVLVTVALMHRDVMNAVSRCEDRKSVV